MKHTKEPWEVQDFDDDNWAITTKDDINIAWVERHEGEDYEQEYWENAARIVDCVNSLAGIDNPSATLWEVRELLEMVINQRTCDHEDEYLTYKENYGVCAGCRDKKDIGDKAQALLEKLPKE
jgi:hypothetical protein